MSNDVNLYTFPKYEYEALAMLYIQNQDLSGLTPEEIYDKYKDACNKIKEQYKAKRKETRLNKVNGSI